MENRFKILNTEKNFTEEFKLFCLSFGSEIQILNVNSDSPIVKHEKMKQVTYVFSGGGQALLDGELVELTPGLLIFINKECPHSFKAEKELHLLHWHYPREFIEFDRVILSNEMSTKIGGEISD